VNYNTAQMLSWAANRLTEAGIENARCEAEYIFAAGKEISRNQVLAKLSRPVDILSEELFRKNIEKRGQRIPFGYIFNRANFMGYDLKVTGDTLIPRPETEILVEEAAKYLKSKEGNLKVLDIGTGSGNIAIAIAKFTSAQITATDISARALKVASENSGMQNADVRIEFIQSNLYKSLTADYLNYFDLIISNPPYVNLKEYAKIQPEVKKEPKNALVASGKGLGVIKKILTGAGNFLKERGIIFMEIGYNQRKDVEKFITEKVKFTEIEFIKDYEKIDRILKLTL
jgi:release factor glutamine methyltransferase